MRPSSAPAGYDVAVIGAGIAGLSAAAHLARAGKRVVVFEQHDKPGGYYTSFTRSGIIFDITAHWTVAPEPVNRMLEALGAPPIHFVHHPKIGQYRGPGARGPVLLVNDRERFTRSILDAYPAAGPAAIDTLIETALKVEAEIDRLEPQNLELMSLPSRAAAMASMPFKLLNVTRYGRIPAKDYLQRLFPGEALAGLRAALYMLAPIKDFSAIGILLYVAFALRGRAYQPHGGALRAAEAFARAAALNGVTLSYNQSVSGIRVEQGRVVGLTLHGGDRVECAAVVSAADIRQTFTRLLDPALVPAEFRHRLETTPTSGTFVIVSIVTEQDPAEYGFDGMDAFITDSADIDTALRPDDPERSMISIQFPEFRTESAAERLFGLQLVAPATFGYQNHWATGPGFERNRAYQALKTDFAARLIARAENYMPGFSRQIRSVDVATPITMYRYTLNDMGSPVGWSYTSTRRWKQRVPFVGGLVLAGHWVGPSGIYNVALSGRNAAELILAA